MKTKPLLIASALSALVAGCTTSAVTGSRAQLRENAHFTIAHLDPSQVDVQPRPVKIVRPQLQMTPQGTGPDGYAMVEFVVDTAGIPREVQWVEASDAHIAKIVTAAVAESRYSPAMIGGKAVATTMAQRWEFHSKKVSIAVLPPYTSRSGTPPAVRPTNYAEQGVNPRPPTYQPGGPLP